MKVILNRQKTSIHLIIAKVPMDKGGPDTFYVVMQVFLIETAQDQTCPRD